MDHSQAMRLGAAEKYVMGELTAALRDEYEEHYFECAECAADLQATLTFVKTSRELLSEEPPAGSSQAVVAAPGGWLSWFGPRVAVPVFAVLLISIAYLGLVSVPRARESAWVESGHLIGSTFDLQLANTRSEEQSWVRTHPEEGFALRFDFTPSASFPSYVCELQDAQGGVIVRTRIPAAKINHEVVLSVPGGRVTDGRYELQFTGGSGPGDSRQPVPVLKLNFRVELLR